MAHAGMIIGIPGLEVVRVKSKRCIDVWARPYRRQASCQHCGASELRIKATHKRTVKHTRRGNQVMILHLKVPKYHCQGCGRYFRHRFAGLRPRYRSSDTYQMEVYEAHDGGVTQRKLSRTHMISGATVERWYRGLQGKSSVQVVVMDLSETYRSIARKYFPGATIVADRFHVVRLINQHFLKVWQQHDPEGRKNRGLISLMRRHQWSLKDEQHANLMTYLASYPVLQQLYVAKQKLARLMLLKTLTAKRARKKLPQLFELLDQLRDSPLRTLAKTLTSWLEPIVAMWRFSKTNGITEGFHNKMEMISRRAYGFRNFENYRLRVLTHCGRSFPLPMVSIF